MNSNLTLGSELPMADRQGRRLAWVLTGLVIAWVFAWYGQTTVSIVAIWYRAETFAHGFVILPIVIWLVWRDRDHLSRVAIAPFPPALIPLGIVGFGWLVSQLAAVVGGAQFMLVAMMPLAVWAIMGTAMVRALAFPLAFTFFAVPFGEFVVPVLIDWTANFTVWAVAASGVPVFRDGNEFIIPSGRWSVVEACSGVRYLIASLVVGTLYAYLTYRSTFRRAVFIGIAIIVPLVANWLRAYMIVMIGHLSNNRLAVGVDHIIYGWVFFGIVMLALFWVAGYWREDLGPVPRREMVFAEPVTISRSSLLIVAVATLAISTMWKPLLTVLDGRVSKDRVVLAPIQPTGGWTPSSQPDSQFKPHYRNPAAETRQAFSKDGVQVGVYIGFYRNQTQDSELVSHHNQIVVTTDQSWRRTGSGVADAMLGTNAIRVRVSRLRDARTEGQLVLWHWYWIDGRQTTSDVIAKLYLALSRLTGQGDDSAVIVLFTPEAEHSDSGTVVLKAFAREMGPSIEDMLRKAERR